MYSTGQNYESWVPNSYNLVSSYITEASSNARSITDIYPTLGVTLGQDIKASFGQMTTYEQTTSLSILPLLIVYWNHNKEEKGSVKRAVSGTNLLWLATPQFQMDHQRKDSYHSHILRRNVWQRRMHHWSIHRHPSRRCVDGNNFQLVLCVFT